MKVKDVVMNKRIITVPESSELYTKNINQILQREIDLKRINKIREYLLVSNERFFSSLIVAIHKGDPQWADFDIERQFRIDKEILDDDEVEFIENKLGILTLSGNEEMFVLDGQHRLLGLRKAFEADSKIGDDEISLLLIVHKKNLKERTRRLFTVLNRYAEKIKPAEKVILEEDDAAAILTRKLVQENPIFIKDNAVASTKVFNLPATDFHSFTTLVCLYEINKVVIGFNNLYRNKVITRPSNQVLATLEQEINGFWTFYFQQFPEVVKFIEGKSKSKTFVRNKATGGSLLLRPEGQLLFATVYKEYKEAENFNRFKESVGSIDFNLSGPIWKYVFWKGDKMETKFKKLKRAIFKYLLGSKENEKFVHAEMEKIYKEYNDKYSKKIKPVI